MISAIIVHSNSIRGDIFAKLNSGIFNGLCFKKMDGVKSLCIKARRPRCFVEFCMWIMCINNDDKAPPSQSQNSVFHFHFCIATKRINPPFRIH